jgi:hypothetical protein
MSTKAQAYRATLRALPEGDWDAYLLRESGLPGPRGNLELAQAVADEAGADRLAQYAAMGADIAPTGTADEFLAFCGVVGLGRLLADGAEGVLADLRGHASDPRWRVREAVAMALQRLGDADIDRLLPVVRDWAGGTPLEQRAAAAAICEPRLLRRREPVRAALGVLDLITASIPGQHDRKTDAFMALRKGMGYCWSVAVAALPDEGRPLMERWAASDDRDIRWIIRENLRKGRLARVDAAWVASMTQELQG